MPHTPGPWKVVSLPTLSFTCPRTCPAYGERWCRFRPLLDRLGPVKVDSHTATIRVSYTDPEQLRIAVESMGGVWLGHGHYDLGDTQQDGYGFRLPMAGGWSLDGSLKTTYVCSPSRWRTGLRRLRRNMGRHGEVGPAQDRVRLRKDRG